MPGTGGGSRGRARTAVLVAAWLGFAVLLALHLDFWRPRRAEIWFGWIPEDLVWRLAWMALAFGYLLFFCRWVWTDTDVATGEDEGA